MNKNDFWNFESKDFPKLTAEMVTIAEEKLKVKLPKLFIELLQLKNGGDTNEFAFPMKEKTAWAEDHVPLYELNGIITDNNIDTTINLLLNDYMTNEWGLPEKQVLLYGEGHYWITLDYRKGDEPTVRWIDVDQGEDIHMADSFEEFINGLVPMEEFEEDDDFEWDEDDDM